MAGESVPHTTRRELLLAALLALLFAAALLWAPIVRVRTHTLGPWDWIGANSLFLREGYEPTVANYALADPARQMGPWALLAKETLEQGMLPLWNPYNSNGAPLFANYQSALASPFTLPVYMLPFGAGVLVSTLLKLACAAFFAYGFARSLRFSRAGSALAAAAYTCSAGHLMLLLHPHSGVTALLPALLWAIESLRQSCARDDRASAARAGIELALATAATCLAGHPEMLIVSAATCAVVGGLALVRTPPPQRAFAFRTLSVAALAGALVAAPQLVMFAEYFLHSVVWVAGSMPTAGAPVEQLPQLFFPMLTGTPFDLATHVGVTPAPNFQESITYCVGALPIWLLCFALCTGALRSRIGGFLVFALVLVVAVWNIGPIGEPLNRWISLGVIPEGRFYPLFSLGCALACAHVLTVPLRARTVALGAALALFLWGAAWLGAEHFIDAHPANASPERWRELAAPHITHVTRWYVVGVAALCAAWLFRRRLVVALATGTAIFAHAAATDGVTRQYVPTVPNEQVEPRTTYLASLEERLGNESVVFLGEDRIWVEANAPYHLHTPVGYDALGVLGVSHVQYLTFASDGYNARVDYVSPLGLRLCGARYIVSRHEWLPIDTQLGNETTPPAERYLSRFSNPYESAASIEVTPISTTVLREEFSPERAGLSGLVLHIRNKDAAKNSPLLLRLLDAETGRELTRKEFIPIYLTWLGPQRLECVLRFEVQADSATRRYAVELSALDAAAPQAEVVLLPQGHALDQGRRVVTDLQFGDNFLYQGWIERGFLYELRESRGRAWLTSGIFPVPDADTAYHYTLTEPRELYRDTVLQRPGDPIEPRADFSGEVELVEEFATRSRWRTRSNAPAAFVLTQAHYPGWRATLDGAPAPLLAANLGFVGVEVPEGEHVIDLRYEPLSLRIGLLLALVSLPLIFLLHRSGRPRSTP